MMVSSSFAVGAPKTYWVVDGQTYKLNQSSFNPIIVYAGMASQPPQSSRVTYCSQTVVNNVSYLQCEYYELTGATGKEYYYEADQWQYYHSTFTCSLDTNTCPAPSTIVNGECVLSDSLDCDPTKGTFTNLDGSCTDCSSHLFDVDVSGVANCACGAKGATYTPSGVLGQVSVQSDGNSTVTQSSVKCSDGSSKYVYYNKKIPTDNNTSTPTDNNNTNDNNTSVPTDNNGTKDGNSTTPTDGNGTKDGNGTSPSGTGKDYTDLLVKISGYLNRIDSSLNGDASITPISNNIPTDTSASSWDTYSETWNNIMNSLDEVTNSVGELQGLISNGFTSPFSKSSVSSCSYTTSFDFGDVGTFPISVDLCKVFSPLHGVIYTFAYLFFVFSILLFHVKMFLRLF